MDSWHEIVASSWGKEFIAGGIGGTAGVVAGYPLDTVRIWQQKESTSSAFSIFRRVIAREGPCALFKGMAAPVVSVAFQNAIVFQSYATLSRKFDDNATATGPPSYKGVALGGIGAGFIQSLVISPVELLKIRLQLRSKTTNQTKQSGSVKGPLDISKSIIRSEGLKGIFRGFTVTVLRDAPSHGLYFWAYEHMREQIHPGCRESGQDNIRTMLLAGGFAGVVSWIVCYPLDVVKTRIQAQSHTSPLKYRGIADCFRKSVREEGCSVLWRGLGSTVFRAFIVNGAVFAAYEIALRCI